MRPITNRRKETGGLSAIGPLVCAVAALIFLAPGRVAGQSPLDGPARLTVDSVTIEQALRALQRSAGISLLYSPDLLPADRRVSCACELVTVRQALERILQGTGLTYQVGRAQVRIVPPPPRRQERAATGFIAGRVVGADAGTPVSGVLVQLGDERAVLTGEDGAFLIPAAAPGVYRLRAALVGWAETRVDGVTIAPGDTSRVDIVMERAPVPLPAIVVAPGTFSMLDDVPVGAQRALTREEIQTMPQVGEDIFRAMKRLPGVASSDISTKLHVRGGADSEVLVRLDGMELYEPYHMKDWDGAVGIIDLNALGGVELTAGGFGVEYGNRMAGVFDMRSRTSASDARTTLGLSITNVTALSRGGIDNGRGTWLVSARQGFMGLVIRLIGEDRRLSPQYYDAFGKVSYLLSPTNRLTAHVLWGGDRFGLHEVEQNDLDQVDLDTGWDSGYGWLTWEWTPHPRLTATTMAWTGRVTRRRDGLVADFGRPDMPDSMTVLDNRGFGFAGVRHDLGIDLSDDALLKAGVELRRLHGDYHYSGLTSLQYLTAQGEPAIRNDRLEIDLDNRGRQLAAWLAARVRPWSRLTAEAGVRFDRATYTGDADLAPRLLAALDLSERTTLRGSYGRYWQSQGIQELAVGDGEMAYSPAERSDQLAVGVSHRLGRDIDLRLEAYSRAIGNQRARFISLEQDLRIFPELEGDRLLIEPGRGRARGVELGVERREGVPWAWSANYALSLAEDQVPASAGQPCNSGADCTEQLWLPRQYDQRHALNLQVEYRPDRDWNLSLAWKYHSGWPATEWTYQAVAQPGGGYFWTRSFGPVRAIRLPAYHRLDLRVTRELQVRGNPLSVFVDLFNLYDRTNIASWRYDPRFVDGHAATVRHDGLTLLPRLPTFGLRYEF